MCDYRQCDVCGKKAFYDAELNYQDTPIVDKQKPVVGTSFYLDWLGDWKVLCIDCIGEYELKIVKINQKHEDTKKMPAKEVRFRFTHKDGTYEPFECGFGDFEGYGWFRSSDGSRWQWEDFDVEIVS
jgi:hypothetical protein